MSQIINEASGHENVIDAEDLGSMVNGAWAEMLESEKTNLVHRIQDLEKKVSEQNDEIVCLRGTLADTLRRVSQLESNQTLTRSTPSTPTIQTPTPIKSRLTPTRSLTIISNGPNYAKAQTAQTAPPPVNRNRYRLSVHESNNSLNSSMEGSNDSSDSPVPHTNQNSSSNFYLAKRWSSTGDFNHNSVISPTTPTGASKLSTSTRSLLNLNSRLNFKHGTKETVFNVEEGTVTVYFRDKPVTFLLPSEHLALNNYDICKVQTAPGYKLELEWVYGYRGRDCRANLHLLPTGELIYFVSAIVILYNVEEQQQRHYLGHTDDVKCMNVHPNKLLVATGQSTSISNDRKTTRAHIRVWNTVNLHTVSVVGMDYFEYAIACLSFSKADGGKLLAVVDDSHEHTISLWSWQSNHRLAENKCCGETVLVIDFHPFDNNLLISCGKTHVSFWSIDVNYTLYKRMAVFEMRDKPKYITAIAFSQNGDIITGDSNGNILFWTKNQNKYQRVIKRVHSGAVFSICALRDGKFLTGGGKDGLIVAFSPQWVLTGDEYQIEVHFGGVRVIAEGRGSQIIVGTTRNCILMGNISLGLQPVIMGHTDELFALASHPSLPQFVTGGFDNLLQMWDSMSHIVVWSKDIGSAICAVTFSSLKDEASEVVAVACKNGQWLVLDTLTREVIFKSSDGVEPLLCAQFAPNNQFIAFGSADHSIYVYQVTDLCHKYLKVGKCVGHASNVIRFDWSTDGQFLRSNGIDYETLYWNSSTCRQVLNGDKIRDIKWATNNCILSFHTLGTFPDNFNDPMVTCTTCNNLLGVLAGGDDCGTVKLFTYPAVQPKSLSFNVKAHRNEVSNVTFLCDDSRLISIGATDTLVLQWSLIQGAPNNNTNP